MNSKFEKLLEDLRFFIGSFFLVVGLALVGKGLVTPILMDGYNLNLIAGAVFLLFSCPALLLAWDKVR